MVRRERDFNAKYCSYCDQEVGMMGHGPEGCPKNPNYPGVPPASKSGPSVAPEPTAAFGFGHAETHPTDAELDVIDTRIAQERAITACAEEIFEIAKSKGWWNGVAVPLDARERISRLVVFEKLMLIVTEVAEAMEDLRSGKAVDHVEMVSTESNPKPKPCGFPTELADVVIRVFDLAVACGIDIGVEIRRKMAYNETREYRHGGKLA